MAIDFDAIRKKLNQLSGNNSRRNVMWRPQEGEEATVRLLSFPDNDGQPFKERWFYYNIGNNPGLLAPYQFGKPDPIQELITKLRDDGSKESYELAKKLYPKMRSYAPVIVRGEEDKGVRIWSFGKTVYQSLLNIMLDEDYGDITDVEAGTDIVLNYDRPGTPGSFPKTTLKPRRRPSVLCDDDVADCEALLDSIPDIGSQFERKTTADVQAILNETLSSDGSEGRTSETRKYGDQDAVDAAFDKLGA